MVFVLVLGALLGGATVVLLQQWRVDALTAPPTARRLPRPTVPPRSVERHARTRSLLVRG